ncbi:MAG: hypothetical protein OYK82_04030 [Gammaproteobacteria bacterium]|nr:hypothetical protein [Gammaproteobacteria bacterium]
MHSISVSVLFLGNICRLALGLVAEYPNGAVVRPNRILDYLREGAIIRARQTSIGINSAKNGCQAQGAKVNASVGASSRSRESGRPRTRVVDLATDVRLIGRFDLRVTVNNVFGTSCATASLFAARAGNIPGDPRTLAVTLATGSLFLEL